MRKRLAVVAVALTALAGVAAGGGLAADQQRLHDRTADVIQDQTQTKDQLHDQLRDGSCLVP